MNISATTTHKWTSNKPVLYWAMLAIMFAGFVAVVLS